MLVARMNFPTRVDPRIVVDLEQRTTIAFVEVHDYVDLLLGIDRHRPELRHEERRAVTTDPSLAEQHRSAVLQLDGERGERDHRQQQDQRQGRDDDVE